MTKPILNLKEVIETLSTYNIEHCKFPHNYMVDFGYDIPFIRGLAMDDKKLILINNEQSIEDIRESIIHELIHTVYFRKGNLRKNIERTVQGETKKIYKKIYGVDI